MTKLKADCAKKGKSPRSDFCLFVSLFSRLDHLAQWLVDDFAVLHDGFAADDGFDWDTFDAPAVIGSDFAFAVQIGCFDRRFLVHVDDRDVGLQ